MNFKNLAMWAIIVFLTIGLYNLFKNPQNINEKNNITFSEFLKEVDDGRVVKVEIKGKNIKGILSDGVSFYTYAPDDPNLVEKLTSKNVNITNIPIIIIDISLTANRKKINANPDIKRPIAWANLLGGPATNFSFKLKLGTMIFVTNSAKGLILGPLVTLAMNP